jgi:hypothetical protein
MASDMIATENINRLILVGRFFIVHHFCRGFCSYVTNVSQTVLQQPLGALSLLQRHWL